MFIATSIEIIEISDVPQAVRKALTGAICRERITVSSAIEVSRPLTTASTMMVCWESCYISVSMDNISLSILLSILF